MRRREVSASEPGGEWGVTNVTRDSRAGGGGTNVEVTAGRTAGAVTGAGSALTKCRKTLVVQERVTGTGRLQQLCGEWAVRASSNCGQEKQFPQNSAATTTAASSELESAFIPGIMIAEF